MKKQNACIRRRMIIILAIGFLLGNLIASFFYEEFRAVFQQVECLIVERITTMDDRCWKYGIEVLEVRAKSFIVFLLMSGTNMGSRIYLLRFLRKSICFGLVFRILLGVYWGYGIALFVIYVLPHEGMYLCAEGNIVYLREVNGIQSKNDWENKVKYFFRFLIWGILGWGWECFVATELMKKIA